MIKFRQVGFSQKELRLLWDLKEYSRMNGCFPPQQNKFDPDGVYVKIVIDEEKRLVVATLDEEVADMLSRGWYDPFRKGGYSKFIRMLNGKAYCRTRRPEQPDKKACGSKKKREKDDPWDEEIGIAIAKSRLIKNMISLTKRRVYENKEFIKKWTEGADEAISRALTHISKVDAIIEKRLADLNKKEIKNESSRKRIKRSK